MMRAWLERALQTHERPFAFLRDAQQAFDELSEDAAIQSAELAGALLAFPSETEAVRPSSAPVTPAAAAPPPHPPARPAPQPATKAPTIHAPAVSAPRHARKEKPAQTSAQAPTAATASATASATTTSASAPVPAAPVRRSRKSGWIIALLCVLVLAEAAAIGVLVYFRPHAEVAILPARADVAPSTAGPSISPDLLASLGGNSPAPTTASTAAQAPAASPVPPATPPAARFGGVRISAPIDLQVFRNGELVGSTAGPIAINQGRHALEVVNAALGFRAPVTVNVAAGQMARVTVPIPDARVNINAVPWADVTIGGAALGQTPLANLALPIGTHEVVFRHPQLGERRQTITVRVDGARVTQNMR
jgi:hypothetical protein